jgi:hypothetical protein
MRHTGDGTATFMRKELLDRRQLKSFATQGANAVLRKFTTKLKAEQEQEAKQAAAQAATAAKPKKKRGRKSNEGSGTPAAPQAKKSRGRKSKGDQHQNGNKEALDAIAATPSTMASSNKKRGRSSKVKNVVKMDDDDDYVGEDQGKAIKKPKRENGDEERGVDQDSSENRGGSDSLPTTTAPQSGNTQPRRSARTSKPRATVLDDMDESD